MNFRAAWVLLAGLLVAGPLRADDGGEFLWGGVIRAGGFALTEQPSAQYPGGPGYYEADLENSLGSHFMVEHWPDAHWFYGWQYHRYYLRDDAPEANQTVDLKAHFATVGGAWHRTDQSGRHFKLGLSVGVGQGTYQNNLTWHPTEERPDPPAGWSFHDQGQLLRAELFFQSQIRSGWGYRIGYALQTGETASSLEGAPVSLDAGPFPSVTLVGPLPWF